MPFTGLCILFQRMKNEFLQNSKKCVSYFWFDFKEEIECVVQSMRERERERETEREREYDGRLKLY